MERKPKVYVRCDGNAIIGAGHIMRCLTITDCMDSATQVTYLCADEASAELVKSRGTKAIVLGTNGQKPEEELPILQSLFAAEEAGEQQRIFLVDSYFVTREYLQQLGNYGAVIYLDDLCEETYPVQGIINYNAFAEQEEYAGRYPKAMRLIGPAYVPLRPQFVEETAENQGKEPNEFPKSRGEDSEGKALEEKREYHILLTTGGGDKDNIAGKILERMEPICKTAEGEGHSPITIHVIAGQFSPNYEKLQQFAKVHEGVIVHSNVQNMGALMRNCNLGITAGGTTIYEMCASGLPMICFAYARNQEALVSYVKEKEIGFSAGNYHMEAEETLRNLGFFMERILKEPEEAMKRSVAAWQLVDGHGAERIAWEIEHFNET